MCMDNNPKTSDSKQFVIRHNGKEVGPLTSANLRHLMKTGQVDSTCPARGVDEREWSTIDKVVGNIGKTANARASSAKKRVQDGSCKGSAENSLSPDVGDGQDDRSRKSSPVSQAVAVALAQTKLANRLRRAAVVAIREAYRSARLSFAFLSWMFSAVVAKVRRGLAKRRSESSEAFVSRQLPFELNAANVTRLCCTFAIAAWFFGTSLGNDAELPDWCVETLERCERGELAELEAHLSQLEAEAYPDVGGAATFKDMADYYKKLTEALVYTVNPASQELANPGRLEWISLRMGGAQGHVMLLALREGKPGEASELLIDASTLLAEFLPNGSFEVVSPLQAGLSMKSLVGDERRTATAVAILERELVVNKSQQDIRFLNESISTCFGKHSLWFYMQRCLYEEKSDDLEKEVERLEALVELCEEALGSENSIYWEAQNNIAAVLWRQGKKKECREMLEKGYREILKYEHPMHPWAMAAKADLDKVNNTNSQMAKTFAEAPRQLTASGDVDCPYCNGTGSTAPGSAALGSGLVGSGAFRNGCLHCGGSGKVWSTGW